MSFTFSVPLILIEMSVSVLLFILLIAVASFSVWSLSALLARVMYNDWIPGFWTTWRVGDTERQVRAYGIPYRNIFIGVMVSPGRKKADE